MTNIVRRKQDEARPSLNPYEVQEVEQPTNELILTRKVKVQDYRKTGQLAIKSKDRPILHLDLAEYKGAAEAGARLPSTRATISCVNLACQSA